MLIKTQVKRRAESINQYILSVKQKVYQHRYKEAKLLIAQSKQSINNSYMAPYDPHMYLLDSLKAKNEKLVSQRESMEQQIMGKLEQINSVKIRRGYGIKQASTSIEDGKNQMGQLQWQDPQEWMAKMELEEVGVYISRLGLRLSDVEKLDYEIAMLETNFQAIRITVEINIVVVYFRQIVSMEVEGAYLLICWRMGNDNTNNKEKDKDRDYNNYLVIKFDNEEDRKYWGRAFTFAKLICQCQLKERLFFKEEQYNIRISQHQDATKADPEIPEKIINSNTRYTNLNIGSNRSPAIDRLRRKSEYYPTGPGMNTLGLINRAKSRKVSEDLTMKDNYNRNNYFYDKKMYNQKSQKSFEDEGSLTNSMQDRKEPKRQSSIIQPKKQQTPPVSPPPVSKLQKLKEERQKLYQEAKISQNQNTQSNRQIFFNESSIHWIQEENQDIGSRSSHSKHAIIGKKNILDMLNNNNGGKEADKNDKSQHISEVPAQIQQSPLLPYSMRDKRRRENSQDSNKFQVRIKQVSMTKEDKKDKNSPEKKKDGPLIPDSPHKARSIPRLSPETLPHEEEEEDEDDKEEEEEESAEEDEIESINQQSGQQSQKQKQKSRRNGDVQDKSQDLASQNQNSQTQSRKYGLDDLISGIMLLKCSANGWNSHLKKLHLSNNNDQLCWKNQKGDDLKKINLSDIQRIQYNSGTITEGILRHIKNIDKKRCMVIRYRQKGKTKFLEFYLPDNQKISVLEQFYDKLSKYVRFKNHEGIF